MIRRRWRSALGTAVLPLAALAAVHHGVPAASAAEPCLGEPATIVGPGEAGVLVGTAGDDVIVTDGATDVDALGGDDVVCVTGADTDVAIDAGEGDDVVNAYSYDAPPAEDRRGARRAAGPVITIDLGPGRDRGRLVADDSPGNEYVDTDAGLASDFVVKGGGGSLDVLELQSWWQVDRDEPLDGDVYVDVAAGSGSIGNEVTVGFSGFESYVADAQGTATMLGTSGPDYLAAFGCGSTVVKAGAGSDVIGARGPRSDDDELWCVPTRGTARGTYLDGGAHGDRIDVAVAAVVRGGSGSDRISALFGCHGYAYHDDCGSVLHGEAGNDVIFGGNGGGAADREVLDGGTGNDNLIGGAGPDRLLGYAGDDLLYGSRGDDALYGGAGRDQARGGTQTDLCRAEFRRGCER